MRNCRPHCCTVLPAELLSRREALSRLAWLAALPVLGGIGACAPEEPLVRVATNIWPGYEFMYLARERGYFGAHPLRMLELGSASACLDMLAAGTAEAAGLTLDEVLRVRAQGLDLRVLAVLDISMGADAVLARPGIDTPSGLAGQRIGVERSAVGALILDAVLQAAGLAPEAVEIVEVSLDGHIAAYRQKRVDAIVSFEPTASQLEALGAQRIYDSRQIPGRIMDVLVAKPAVIERSPAALRALLRGHFLAHADFVSDPSTHALMVPRLGGAAADIPSLFAGIEIPDAARNRQLFAGPAGGQPGLAGQARILADVMLRAGLLQTAPDFDRLFDGRLLPEPDQS